jgi:shikimate kinase
MPTPELSDEKPAISCGEAKSWRARPLVLIGLMGAGKSTIGRRLAREIGWRFVDSDEEIEAAAGCSVADIFAIHGESIFRDLEKRVIARLVGEEPLVLATGGGAWMQAGVREIIKQHATSVWLRADIDVLTDRVSRRSHRPLLETGDKREILERLMGERYPVYAQADYTVDSSHGPHDRVVERVIETLDQPKGNT